MQAPYLGLGDSYYVDFGFDHDGGFRIAALYASGTEEFMGETVEQSITISTFLYDDPMLDVLGTIEHYAENPENAISTFQTEPPEPDWGVTLTAENVTASGLTLVCVRSGGSYPGNLMTGRHYWVERWTGSEWVVLETAADTVWAMDAQMIEQGQIARWNSALESIYGKLEPGTYRIGKNISNVAEYRVGVDPSIAEQTAEEITHKFYAEFVIEQDIDDPLARCENALKAFQAQETYCLMVEWQYSGDILNDNSTLLFYRDGDAWMRQGLVSGVDQSTEDWYLEKDGVQYTREVSIIHDPANGDSSDTGWMKTTLENEDDLKCWLPTFDWDAAEITFVDADSGGDTVTFTVQGAPFDQESAQVVEQYTVTFSFYPESNTLRNAVLSYTSYWPMVENGQETTGVSNHVGTISLNAMAPEDAAATIERVYTQEIAGT